MKRLNVDVCVIGAGSGGLSLAAGAVQMGASVALIEGHKMGGDCLNFGCVPSKALLAAAAKANAMAGGFGVAGVEPQVDYAAAKDHVAQVIAQIAPVDSQERFEGLGVQVIRAFGQFISATEVQAGETVITARRFVIATGSAPFVPPIPGLAEVPYLTNETIFDLRERPSHLLVIGGGPIGMEMAQAHCRLGCRVTVISSGPALPKDDPELTAIVTDRLRAEGVEILQDVSATAARATAAGVEVDLADGKVLTGSHLLVAAGRRAVLDRLNLAAAGIKTGKGCLVLDATLRTTNRRVYALGDAAGELQFTHVAGYHAGVVIRSILFGLPARSRMHHIPWATYTDPELAHVGLTEEQARRAHGGMALTVVRFPYHDNDRAVASGKTTGLIKVMVVRGRPVGASIVGAQAGELIGLWAMAIANRMKMSAIAGTVLPYPTLSEISKRAAGAYFAPKLFDSPGVKRVVRLVQRILP